MNTPVEDAELLDALVAIRPDQTDALARSLRASVRRAVVGAEGEPFRFARFTVLEPLGGGGMGTVFLAYDPDLDRKIALKVLHNRGERGRREVLREGRALARLTHPGVVTVYDVGVFEQQVFVAMEYVEGCDLRAWLREPRAAPAVLTLLIEAGRGLAAAHDAGLVHLDFKPDNLLVDAAGHGRVIDFGLARAIEDHDPRHHDAALPSSPARGGGTPAYMAPERRDGVAGDHRSDQYSFCVTAWEALFGQRPRAGDAAPPERPGVPMRVVSALRRGMSPAPTDRFASMHALLAELTPRPARRWRALAAVATTGLVLGAYMVGQRSSAPTPHCVSRWEQVTASWNPGRADEVGAAFTATGAPFSHEAWATVRPALDRYADAWVDAHARACEDAKVHGILPEAQLEERRACLEDRRLHLAALVERFASPDVQTITQAVAAIERLPPIDACDHLGSADAMFAGDLSRVEAHLAIRGALARARAELDTGRPAAAASLLEEALTRARAVDSPALLAEVLVVAGNADRLANRFERALERTREALALAVAHAEPMQAGWAALLLVQLRDVRGDGGADTRDLLALADAFARQAGDPPQLKLIALMTRGIEAIESGDAAEACERLGQARAFAEQHGQPRGAVVALGNIGKCRGMLGDYAGAAAAYGQAIAGLEPLVGARHPWVGMLHVNLGSTLIEFGDHDAARRHFERAKEVIAQNFPGDHVMTAAVHINTAVSYSSQRRWAEAVAEHEAALGIYERLFGPNHRDVGLALCNIGLNLRSLGRHDEALVATTRGNTIQAATLPADHCEIMGCNTFHGSVLHALGRDEEALQVLEATHERFAALECPADQLGELELELAQALWASAGAAQRARTVALLDAAQSRISDPDARAALDRLRAQLR